jgi:hypothetical protein
MTVECFMKSFILAAALIVTQSTFANACIGEAQFIARVAKVSAVTQAGCLVAISSFKMYNVNQTCPLDISEAVSRDISVGNCPYKVGDEISGIIVVNENGHLILE